MITYNIYLYYMLKKLIFILMVNDLNDFTLLYRQPYVRWYKVVNIKGKSIL